MLPMMRKLLTKSKNRYLSIAIILLTSIIGGCNMNNPGSDFGNTSGPTEFSDEDVTIPPTNTQSHIEFFVEGLKIPPLSIAHKLTEEISNTPGSVGYVSPMNYSLQLAIDKGLCVEDGFGEKYMYMQALYRKVFESWFLESTSLREYNNLLANSELGFGAVPEKRQEFYQLYSTMDLPFVYLCSNIPIERLEKVDLALLQAAIESGKSDVTPELMEMVKRTYSDVMMAFPDMDDDVLCGYGYGGDISPNRSIVLEIRNYDYDENGNFRDPANNARRDEYMIKMAEEMQQVLSEQIMHRVIVKVGY